MATDTGLGLMGGILPIALLLMSAFMNMTYVSFERKCPSYKNARLAYRKGKQFAWVHTSNGTVSGEVVDGVSIPLKEMNKAEYIDNRLPSFHYIQDDYLQMIVANKPVTNNESTFLSRAKRLSEAKGISKPNPNNTTQSQQLPQSPQPSNQQFAKKMTTSGTYIWTDASDFLYSLGMSAAGSLREWKSYITVVARGEGQNKSVLNLEAKTIGTIIIFAIIALVIMKAGTMSSVIGNVTGT